MIAIGVTQRVEVAATGERRDCLDQRWADWLAACGLLPILLPNRPETAVEICRQAGVAGLLFTGGNDLVAVGGDAPERDATESRLFGLAGAQGLPLIGVCRGMQVIQWHCGVPLAPVAGHVAAVASVRLADGTARRVNSYHRFGTVESRDELEVWARATDGTVKAIRHRSLPILGLMWHPERLDPFPQVDIALFRRHYERPAACAA